MIFIRDGFAVTESVLPATLLARLKQEFTPLLANGSGGIRNVLQSSEAARIAATSGAVHNLLRSVAGGEAFVPVRGILFDKTTSPGGTNWKVPYHQDLSIAVQERPPSDVAGYETWSVKDGVVHVQPPRAILERLLTVRLHLDPCDGETGALRVLPGTHRRGRLSVHEVAQCRAEIAETVCAVPEGGAMVFRPLLLHASSPATRPDARRRVLHIEFAPVDMTLPGGIRWISGIAHP
ncbi:MAG: phytanoyl-CoA dioxygenase family protein [Akkermansiaceae bacterium]|nr:phytanoyl-CoA dioxygenase family protein [Armatimonadota bacterium]